MYTCHIIYNLLITVCRLRLESARLRVAQSLLSADTSHLGILRALGICCKRQKGASCFAVLLNRGISRPSFATQRQSGVSCMRWFGKADVDESLLSFSCGPSTETLQQKLARSSRKFSACPSRSVRPIALLIPHATAPLNIFLWDSEPRSGSNCKLFISFQIQVSEVRTSKVMSLT